MSTSSAQESGHRPVPLPIPTPVTEEVVDLRTPITVGVIATIIEAKEASHDLINS